MASIITGYEYDIFISYRQKDNNYDGWVTEFVENLKKELEATIKEDVSVYFDINPHDGLLESHEVNDSLKEKLKCLIFIPIISRTYCDTKSFAWQNEFTKFIELASADNFGLKIKLPGGNVASRVLPVRIFDLDKEDISLCESLLEGKLRGIEFIYKSAGVNRPLRSNEDHAHENLNKTYYRDQINKVAYSIQYIINGIKAASDITFSVPEPEKVQGKTIKSGKILQNKYLPNPSPLKKIPIALSFFLLIIILAVFCLVLKRPPSNDIIQKAIIKVDPLNRWPTYAGKIRLTNIWLTGTETNEVIEINNYDNSYRHSNISNNQTEIRGIENGKYFREFRNTADNALIRSFREDSINSEEIDFWRQHHKIHFGTLMELQNSGLRIGKTAKKVNFQGNKCYSVEFNSDPALQLNNYFNDSNWTIFIDRNDFTLKGARIENFRFFSNTYNVNILGFGELVINNLTIYMCKMYILSHDNSLIFIDIITRPD